MLSKLLALFKQERPRRRQDTSPSRKNDPTPRIPGKIEPVRIGELGEHKINIQLDQLPKDCRYLSDLLIPNPKSRTGYSQIDHFVISPYGLFVIETKNYNGEIKGGRKDKYWSVSSRYKMYNPLLQNEGHIKALASHLGEFKAAKYISMISFTMRCRFSIDPALRKIGSDELIVYDVELSEFIQRKTTRLKAELTAPIFTPEQMNAFHAKVNDLNITDPHARAEHVRKLQWRKYNG
ncbi:nuclease-related domain-containing protein [Paenibacillus apii]|uniref:nuclease-related domain-containing protein n=1 Tax=Paenibacillus apii TaxID=1850370 RepID=UPI00143B79EA|nr:nuclease-related domain-containing protein [Paenibacillus apii]NJJ40618.1 NERD domain-containing protein [Paenibacillus apii]